jgi:hypothetical protein
MKHRVRFIPALINCFAQVFPLTVVIFLIFLAALAYMNTPMDSRAWRVLFSIFGGAVAFTSLAMSFSALADWFAVEPTGLRYRVSHGVGSAQLIMKKTRQTAWEDILAVTSSRYLPLRSLSVEVRRDEKHPLNNSFTLPLYLKEQDAFVQAVLTHAPVGHPIRVVFEV